MTLHLDTSFLIRALVAGTAEDELLRHWLLDRATIEMSAIAWAEFLCGPLRPAQLELAARVVSRRVAFDEPSAELASRLFNLAGRRRGSFADCMIAASAVRSGATLATGNCEDYERFVPAGLALHEAS